MKAVYITKQGELDVLTYGEIPYPEINPNEIIVKIKACALNRLDIYTRSGARGTKRNFESPHILGSDIAGEVVTVGALVNSVKVGARVVLNPRVTCGECRFCLAGMDEFCQSSKMLGSTMNGGYAEYIKVPGTNAIILPPNISFEEAAAMPTVFMPSWAMIVRKAQLKPMETVLVLSASSGVGTAAIQVAKNYIGAKVITTTSTQEKAQKAKELGADEVIIYPIDDMTQEIKKLTNNYGIDVVIDHVGSDFWDGAFNALATGGRYGICGVSTGYKSQLHMGKLFTKQLTVFGVFMGRKEDLRTVIKMAERKIINSVIHKTFSFKDVAEAHRLMESQQFFGKLVLKM